MFIILIFLIAFIVVGNIVNSVTKKEEEIILEVEPLIKNKYQSTKEKLLLEYPGVIKVSGYEWRPESRPDEKYDIYGCVKDNVLYKFLFVSEWQTNALARYHASAICKNYNFPEKDLDYVYSKIETIYDETISIDDIIYYRELGEKTYSTHVDGGGVNVGGALVGAVVAGSTGAIIGSKKSTEIRSSTVEHDDRVCQIMTKKGDMRWSLEFYNILNSYIPEKEYSVVMLKTSNNQAIEKNSEVENINLLKKYKDLLDEGIISEEEFKKKKEELL